MKKTSFVRKLCAAVLSGLIVIGSLPVAMAADDTSPAGSDTSAESAATPDEAAPADSSDERVGSGENPYVKVNDGAVSYYDEASKKFVYENAQHHGAALQPRKRGTEAGHQRKNNGPRF